MIDHALDAAIEIFQPKDHLKVADMLHATLPVFVNRTIFREDYADILPAIFLEEGLVPFLEFLSRRGVRMAVNTNRTNTTERMLEHFGIMRFFSLVINAGGLSHPKPNPEGVYRILNSWRLPREQTAYIGDSYLDEATARAAGVSFWAYKNPKLLAEMHIRDFESLRTCLAKALPGDGL